MADARPPEEQDADDRFHRYPRRVAVHGHDERHAGRRRQGQPRAESLRRQHHRAPQGSGADERSLRPQRGAGRHRQVPVRRGRAQAQDDLLGLQHHRLRADARRPRAGQRRRGSSAAGDLDAEACRAEHRRGDRHRPAPAAQLVADRHEGRLARRGRRRFRHGRRASGRTASNRRRQRTDADA